MLNKVVYRYKKSYPPKFPQVIPKFYQGIFFLYIYKNFRVPHRDRQGARVVSFLLYIATTQNTPKCCKPYSGLYFWEHILVKYPKISRLYPWGVLSILYIQLYYIYITPRITYSYIIHIISTFVNIFLMPYCRTHKNN